MIAVPAGKFFSGWVPLAVAAAAVDPAPRLADMFMLDLGGVPVPPVTCALALVGVLGARPLARKGEQQLSIWLFLLVSALMLIVVELWVLEHRPSALFAFVIAIGLGFSGYSLIELVGQELRSFVGTKVRSIADRFSNTEDEGSQNG